jgi:hypothetical protein
MTRAHSETSVSALPAAGPTQATAAPPPPVSTGAIESEAVPDSWRRYFVDQNRFSAQFPGAPAVTEVGQDVTYAAHNPAGALFMVVCGPSAADHDPMKRARASARSSGRIVSEGAPYFFGTESYLSHVRLPDGSARVMLFVEYGGRECTVTAEVRSRDETSMQFIESFRPEPETR